MSKAYDEAIAALDALQDAKDQFDAAVAKFKRVYQPKSVGLDEWQEHNENVMLELSDDIEDNLG